MGERRGQFPDQTASRPEPVGRRDHRRVRQLLRASDGARLARHDAAFVAHLLVARAAGARVGGAADALPSRRGARRRARLAPHRASDRRCSSSSTRPAPCSTRRSAWGRTAARSASTKFRSMRTDAEKDGPVWASKAGDARTTRVGRVIRKIRVDEIPQFWNILRGEMNFVGPRPERPHFVKQLAEEIPFYEQRHLIPPGLTGLGADQVPLRRVHRGRAPEVAVRPLLHQEPEPPARRRHPVRDRQDDPLRSRHVSQKK